MARALRNRIVRLEAARKRGRRYPGRLGVPPRDRTPDDDADFDVKFKAQQLALVAEARSARLASTIN